MRVSHVRVKVDGGFLGSPSTLTRQLPVPGRLPDPSLIDDPTNVARRMLSAGARRILEPGSRITRHSVPWEEMLEPRVALLRLGVLLT